MSDRHPTPGAGPGTWLARAAAGGGGLLVLVACCAGPVVVAAGLLGVLGAVLRNPFIAATAGLVLLTAVVVVLRSRRACACGDLPNINSGGLSENQSSQLRAPTDTPRKG